MEKIDWRAVVRSLTEQADTVIENARKRTAPEAAFSELLMGELLSRLASALLKGIESDG